MMFSRVTSCPPALFSWTLACSVTFPCGLWQLLPCPAVLWGGWGCAWVGCHSPAGIPSHSHCISTPCWVSYLFPCDPVPLLCWIHTDGFGLLLLPSSLVPLHPQEPGRQGKFISVGLFLSCCSWPCCWHWPSLWSHGVVTQQVVAVGGIVPLGHSLIPALHPSGNDHQALSLPTAGRRGGRCWGLEVLRFGGAEC